MLQSNVYCWLTSVEGRKRKRKEKKRRERKRKERKASKQASKIERHIFLSICPSLLGPLLLSTHHHVMESIEGSQWWESASCWSAPLAAGNAQPVGRARGKSGALFSQKQLLTSNRQGAFISYFLAFQLGCLQGSVFCTSPWNFLVGLSCSCPL